jgi:hypothetical protein
MANTYKSAKSTIIEMPWSKGNRNFRHIQEILLKKEMSNEICRILEQEHNLPEARGLLLRVEMYAPAHEAFENGVPYTKAKLCRVLTAKFRAELNYAEELGHNNHANSDSLLNWAPIFGAFLKLGRSIYSDVKITYNNNAKLTYEKDAHKFQEEAWISQAQVHESEGSRRYSNLAGQGTSQLRAALMQSGVMMYTIHFCRPSGTLRSSTTEILNALAYYPTHWM